MSQPKQEDPEHENSEKRKMCVTLTMGLIGLAVLILLIVIFTKMTKSGTKSFMGGRSKHKWGSKGGSGCGCMAGQV